MSLSHSTSNKSSNNRATTCVMSPTKKRRAPRSSTATAMAYCGLGLLTLAPQGTWAFLPPVPGTARIHQSSIASLGSSRPSGGAVPLSSLFAAKMDKGPDNGIRAFDPLALMDGKNKKKDGNTPDALLKGKGGGGELEGLEDGAAVGPEAVADNGIYKAMLLVVALLWGSNFGALKYLDTCGVDVSLLTAMRFFLASGALLPFLWGKGVGVLTAGLEVGLWVTLGYITQAIGLETTEASKSAFICSLTVVVVPLIQGLLGKKISPTTWAACALAVFGVGLLTLQGATGPVVGDIWSLGQPLGFGIAFMRIEHYMKKFPGKAIPLAAAQMVSVFGISTVWAAINTNFFQNTGDLSILFDTPHFLSLLYTGLISSALAVVIESAALEYVSSEETSVIFSTEPLFAAATSAVVLGERLKPTGMLGGLAILSACLLTQVDVASLATFLPMLSESGQRAQDEIK